MDNVIITTPMGIKVRESRSKCPVCNSILKTQGSTQICPKCKEE